MRLLLSNCAFILLLNDINALQNDKSQVRVRNRSQMNMLNDKDRIEQKNVAPSGISSLFGNTEGDTNTPDDCTDEEDLTTDEADTDADDNKGESDEAMQTSITSETVIKNQITPGFLESPAVRELLALQKEMTSVRIENFSIPIDRPDISERKEVSEQITAVEDDDDFDYFNLDRVLDTVSKLKKGT